MMATEAKEAITSLSEAVVLDTEFMIRPGSRRRIFAMGLGVVRGGALEPLVLFPDSASTTIARGCAALEWACNEYLPVLTWCGTTVDLAPAECPIPGFDWVDYRLRISFHVDCYRLARKAPITLPAHVRYSLKNVAQALGIERASPIRSGWVVPRLYSRSLVASPNKRAWMRAAIVRYLADDLRLTYEVASRLLVMTRTREARPEYGGKGVEGPTGTARGSGSLD